MNDTPLNVTFAADIEAVRAAIRALAAADARGDLGEVLSCVGTGDEPLLPPNVMGQLLMELLPMSDEPAGKMPLESKAYWAAVAEWMGPDWLEAYRRVGAFMIKVEGF